MAVNAPKPPAGLQSGGRALWNSIAKAHELDAAQRAQLEEACRAKDRCDKLHDSLVGAPETWKEGALAQANNTANLMKQLLTALRLPDPVTGKRPQYRGPRGVHMPKGAGTTMVSSLDRARARASRRRGQ